MLEITCVYAGAVSVECGGNNDTRSIVIVIVSVHAPVGPVENFERFRLTVCRLLGFNGVVHNPIHNAVKEITKRDLRVCNRCGCPDLALVQFKSGKWGLVQTAAQRPFWRGEGPAPVALYALKFNYHRCDEYLATKHDAEKRASDCHPKADKPREIIADAMRVIVTECIADKFAQLTAGKGPLFEAMEILMKAQSEVSN